MLVIAFLVGRGPAAFARSITSPQPITARDNLPHAVRMISMKKRTPAKLWASVADRIHLLYRKVSLAQVRTAERELRVKLPPSYIELVTTVGAPAIAPRKGNDKHVENLGYAVLRPAEIVKWTRAMRRSPARDQAEDDAQFESTKKNLARAVLFQLGSNASDGYVFLTDKVDARGEMRVADFAHDYLYELAWSKLHPGVVFKSFRDSTEYVIERIAEHVTQYGAFVW